MAIKVGGTTVINDSMELSNIASVDATTVAALGAAGVGGGGLDATASGGISDGDPVIVNSDGTLSSVSGSIFEQFSSNNVTINTKPIYDPDAQKIVQFYTVNSAMYVVIGTVSGSSISFGSPQSLGVTGYDISASYDTAQNKYAVVYRNSSNNYGHAIVCTLTGSTFSFGTPVTFRSSLTYKLDSTYDVTNGKIVIVYQASNVDSTGYARVCEISNTVPLFGSEYTLNAGGHTNYPSCIYDPVSTKIIIGYEDVNDGQQSATLVGTVSGSGTNSTISAPTTTRTRHGGAQVYGTYLNIDTNSNVIIFSNLNQSGTLYTKLGSVSGGKLVLQNATFLYTATADYSRVTVVFDEGSNKVMAFRGNYNNFAFVVASSSATILSWSSAISLPLNNPVTISAGYSAISSSIVLMANESSKGKGISIVNAQLSNLSANNFIGFSDGNYTNGQTATAQLSGSVDDSQSGLTIGESYFVQSDGSLNTTASSPSVNAGFAVAATKIIVKG